MPSHELRTRELFAFNTVNTISAYAEDDDTLDRAEKLCDRYEHLFSRTRPDSELSRINAAGGKPVDVDSELAAFIGTALRYCEASDGLYDITMGCVTRLWDFHGEIVPDHAAIEEALSHVGYRGVHTCGTQVTLDDPRASIDLGGIAKGYIADKILDLLRSEGIESGLVNLGGNVAVLGEKPDGRPWTVGLRMPTPSVDLSALSSFATVKVKDCSVVTSGIYERAFAKDGEVYHHIIDPKTGYPARTDLLGATVISRSSLDGDGFTTALIIMGLDRALAFVEENPALEAVFVTREGEVFASSAIGDAIPFELLVGSGADGEQPA